MIRLKLNGKWFEKFSTLNVNLKLNTVASTFNFTGFNEFFKILQYDPCQIYFNDELILTGTILNPALKYNLKPQLIGISGYSKTGILEDVNYPLVMYPLQFDGLSLKQIAEKITSYFGLRLKVFENAQSEANLAFEKVSIDPSETIKSFLSKLCNQRGLILAHDNFGRLLLYKVEAKIRPKFDYTEKDNINISFTPNAQGIHSEISVLRQAKKFDNNNQQTTVKSPFISGIDRPMVKTLNDGDEIQETANKMICAEARNFGIRLDLEGFQNVRSGFYVTLEAPFLKQRTKFILESVNFKATPKSQTTQMDLVLPCVYTGIIPANTPFK